MPTTIDRFKIIFSGSRRWSFTSDSFLRTSKYFNLKISIKIRLTAKHYFWRRSRHVPLWTHVPFGLTHFDTVQKHRSKHFVRDRYVFRFDPQLPVVVMVCNCSFFRNTAFAGVVGVSWDNPKAIIGRTKSVRGQSKLSVFFTRYQGRSLWVGSE